MNKMRCVTIIMLIAMVFFSAITPQITYAAPDKSSASALTAQTLSSSDGKSSSNIFEKLFGFLFDKILGPIFNIFGSKSDKDADDQATVETQPPETANKPKPGGNSGTGGSLRGKTVVVDPGHGGSNPGAVANNSREAANNLAVSLKLRDKLVQAGAKVIMTRDTDRTVAAEGSSLGRELQARVDMAEANRADIFVSIHSNSNPDGKIAGAMTFYHSANSAALASQIQTGLIKETGAINKGTQTANFYVLRNTTMPSVLVEMGFVTNAQEAARLNNDAYRNNLAQGIYNGITKYFNNR